MNDLYKPLLTASLSQHVQHGVANIRQVLALSNLHKKPLPTSSSLPPRSAILVFLIIALLVLAVIWMFWASVDLVVRADGRVIPAGKAQVVQHLEGGIVAAIPVVEGSHVKRGDLLVALQDARADSQLGEQQVNIAGLRLKAARLKAEAVGAGSVAGYTANAGATVQIENNLFNDRRNKLAQEISVFTEQVRQKNAELQEVEVRRVNLSKEMEIAERQLNVVNGLIAKNAASKLELLEAQSRVQRLQTSISDAEASIPKLNAGITEAQARMREASARFRADASAELSATQLQMDRAVQGVRGESDRVKRTEIHAPVDGVVNRVYINTIGGIVKAGEPIMELTPSDNKIFIEANVQPSDRAELRPSLPAKIRVGAYDFGLYGTISGHISEVSADTLPDERGNRFYRIQVRVDQIPDAYLNKPILPGMTVSVDVITGHRRVLDYVLSPLHRFNTMAFREPR